MVGTQVITLVFIAGVAQRLHFNTKLLSMFAGISCTCLLLLLVVVWLRPQLHCQ
jgi:hypothetical protein